MTPDELTKARAALAEIAKAKALRERAMRSGGESIESHAINKAIEAAGQALTEILADVLPPGSPGRHVAFFTLVGEEVSEWRADALEQRESQLDRLETAAIDFAEAVERLSEDASGHLKTYFVLEAIRAGESNDDARQSGEDQFADLRETARSARATASAISERKRMVSERSTARHQALADLVSWLAIIYARVYAIKPGAGIEGYFGRFVREILELKGIQTQIGQEWLQRVIDAAAPLMEDAAPPPKGRKRVRAHLTT